VFTPVALVSVMRTVTFAPCGRVALQTTMAHELLDRYDPALLWFDGDWFDEPASPTPQDWWLKADGVDLRPVGDFVQELATCVSRDGNLLLNIGPEGDGSVTAGSVTVLRGLATWTATYGDSVHGATASPFATDPS